MRLKLRVFNSESFIEAITKKSQALSSETLKTTTV